MRISSIVVSGILGWYLLFCVSCTPSVKQEQGVDKKSNVSLQLDTLGFEYEISEKPKVLSETEKLMISHGLIDIQTLDPEIEVELKYSTTDNFFKKDVYAGMQRAYLQKEVAQMLVQAQKNLRSREPHLSLIVYDAARPRSVQQYMWDYLDIPFEEKIKFLSNPRNGSIHNFGAAVDVSIVDKHGIPLDMGTEFDHIGELAYPSQEVKLWAAGELNRPQIENRRLLREVMLEAGFRSIRTEWWHFNAFSREEARQRYPIIE